MMKKVSEGHNPHVVAMLGCVTTQEPLCLLTELVQFGDLLSYFRSNRKIVCNKNVICIIISIHKKLYKLCSIIQSLDKINL